MGTDAEGSLNMNARDASLTAQPDMTLGGEVDRFSFTSCDQVDLMERVLIAPAELDVSITDQITLDTCIRPLWSIGLASGSRWVASVDLELSVHLDSRDNEIETSSLDEAASELSSALSSRTTGSLIASEVTLTSPLTELDRGRDRVSAPLMITRQRAEGGSINIKLNAELNWVTDARGEYQIALSSADLERPLREVIASETSISNVDMEVSAAIRLTCLSGCSARASRYPIVLVHGYAGVDEYFGVLDYFYRVPDTLRDRGYEVVVPSLSPIEWSEERALQLSAALDEAQTRTGARRFNLIAHSQGGLDARLLISSEGLAEHERVATLTTIATPHYGIPIRVADFFSIQDFSSGYMEGFNQRYPDHDATRYFSWSARTCTLVELRCLREHGNEVVTPFLLPTYTLLSRFGPSDGLIPTANMIYGEHLGELSADHFDQIGQIADQGGGPFAHRAFYLDEAARLRTLGF